MSKAIAKTVNKGSGGKICTLLERFGSVVPLEKRRNFWSVNSGDLEYIFNDAKRGYLEAIKKMHPDTGGSENSAVPINRDWGQIKKLFRIYYPRVFDQ